MGESTSRWVGAALLLAACVQGGGETATDAGPTATSATSSTGPESPTTTGTTSTGSTSTTTATDTGVTGPGPTTAGPGTTGVMCDGTMCGDACVDVLVDPAHCGDCDVPCAPDEQCEAGMCTACGGETTLCGGACVDTTSDEAHCGGCDAPCAAGDPCVQGACDAVDVAHVLITGQSLSNGYAAAVVSTTQPYANLSFNTGVRAGAVGLTEFVPLVETPDNAPHGETIASGLANQAGSLWAAEGFDPRVFLLSAHGQDGSNYAKIAKGTTAYTTGMAQVAAGRAIATMRGASYEVRAVAVIHGESDHVDFKPEGNPDYAAHLLTWQADYEADIQALTGQTRAVPFFYCQMSSWTAYGTAHSLIPEQQRRVAADHPDRFYLVTPKYFLPYADSVHLTGEGSRWLGEYYGKALRRVFLDGLPWTPLVPTGAVVNGAQIVVDFAVPAPPLVFDTDAVTDPGNLGFTFSDASGDPPAIVAVELGGPAQVTVTLAGSPGPQARLGYASVGMSGAWAGPTTGPRGNLRDSDATPSLSGRPLYNWAVHFELALN